MRATHAITELEWELLTDNHQCGDGDVRWEAMISSGNRIALREMTSFHHYIEPPQSRLEICTLREF